MTIGTGDILECIETGHYLLIGEPCKVEEFDGFHLYDFDKCRWTWYYTIFLEDEIMYRRVA